MQEWFKCNYDSMLNQNFTLKKFRTIAETSKIYFRNGIHEFLSLKRDLEVPLLVVSGGIGDVAKAALEVIVEETGSTYDNLKPINIVSNLGIFEDETLVRFNEPYVNTMNKAEHVSKFVEEQKSQDIHDHHHARGNIVVMGDMVEDLHMVGNIECDNMLKIGFLNNLEADSHLQESYEAAFDVLVLHDGNLWAVTSLLEVIAGRKVSNKEKLPADFATFIESVEK
mmetsp:Transcript_18997/g.21850  ORF Transcript_18997/g.21850 Transcript_18997/m.21850 type:complete len:225 (-) Transcript_18997:22-696(-)